MQHHQTLLRIIFMGFVMCGVSACDDRFISPTQSETIQGHVPKPTAPTPSSPTSPPESPENAGSSPSDHNTTPPPKENSPTKETYSERTINSDHQSADFKTVEPTPSPPPPHQIISDAMNRLGQGTVSAEEVEKIVQMVLTRIQNDPVVREALQKLAQNPSNTSLQQQVLDYLLKTDSKDLEKMVHGIFQKIEIVKVTFEHYKSQVTQYKETVEAYVQTAKNYSAVAGGAVGALLLNGMFFQWCRAGKEITLGGHHLTWLIGLALESHYVLKFAHSHEVVQSFNQHLGFGALMGAAIIAQCEGINAFKRIGVASRALAFCARRIKGTSSPPAQPPLAPPASPTASAGS